MPFFQRFSLFAWLLLVSSNQVWASVVLTGTRIIYDANQAEQTLQLSNRGDRPFAVQMWIASETNSQPETASAPFLLMPQIFQIMPGSSQAVRLLLNEDPNKQLPQDRESLFYFSFRQVPAQTKEEIEQQQNSNNLMLIFRNTVKLFYRPATIANAKELAGNAPAILQLSKITLLGDKQSIKINNPTGYHLTVSRIAEITANDKVIWNETTDIKPFSEFEFKLKNKLNTSDLSFTVINDYGSAIKVSKSLSP